VNDLKDATNHILSRLGEIEHKVDSLGQTSAFALRMDKERLSVEVKQVFKDSKRKAQVYLAANGQRAVGEIAAHLGIKRQHVGRALKVLAEESLLKVFPEGGRDVWYKLPVDQTIGISRFLMREYSLNADGMATKAKPAKK
jgi:DNA-binding transcriptional ArsR family regulator